MKGTIIYENKPSIISTYSIVGQKESQGGLSHCFDEKLTDERYGESSFEKGECKMLGTSINKVVEKSSKKLQDIDVIIGGDLLNQIISAGFSARDFDIPFLGVYSACSTITESLLLAGLMVNSNKANNVICVTGSHFATAERQYRYPLELGCIRPPQSQWTVTGAGAFLISKNVENMPYLKSATVGRVIDYGVTDANNMGAAMAPACAINIIKHFKNTNTKPSDYDLIVSGDLGVLGTRLLKHLLLKQGYDIQKNHVDCGELIYNISEQDFQGGSGAGCSTVVVASYIYPKLVKKEINRVLFCATGALLSPISTSQGESIPSISHVVCMENL